MSDGKLNLDTDTDDILDERFIEVPITGPGEANRLVVLNGIALSGKDGSGLDTPDQRSQHWDVFIQTKYRLAEADRWLGIVEGNTELLHATWLSLCAITADEEGGFTIGLETVTASINSTNRVRLHIYAGLQGDSTLLKISYQVNFLLKKSLKTP